MKTITLFSIFLSLHMVNIQSMELASNSNAEDIIVANLAYQIAVRDDELQSRVADLRTLARVNKGWGSAINIRYFPLIIQALANTLSFSRDVGKVVAAIELGIAGSRTWLEKEYEDEGRYMALLFMLVSDLDSVLYICPLQYVNDRFKQLISDQTDLLISQLHWPNKSYPTDFAPLLLGTAVAMERCNPKIVWDFLEEHSTPDYVKPKLVRRLIAQYPDSVNAKDEGKHCFWYQALMEDLDSAILKEIVKYPNKLEDQQLTIRAGHSIKWQDKESPLDLAAVLERYDIVVELLTRPDITGNEMACCEYPVIVWIILNYEESRNDSMILKEIIQSLLAKQTCNINVLDEAEKRTPIMIALRCAKIDIVELLLQRPDIDLLKKDRSGNTAYDLAQILITKKLVSEEDVPRVEKLAAKIKEMEREQQAVHKNEHQRVHKHGGCCVVQ